MTRFKLILEYDGTNTVGWQSQDNGVSIQGMLSDAIYKFSGQHVDVVACGRTDAGVHAFAMPCHFDIESEKRKAKSENSPLGRGGDNPGPDCEQSEQLGGQVAGDDYPADTVMKAINFYLKNSPVVVVSAEIVPDAFHARFSCKSRSYRYVILNRSAAPVIDKNRVWFVPRKLSVKKMQAAAVKFLGKHDWTSFRASECQALSPIKTLDSIEITTVDDLILIDVSAQSFLHHMVRNIVGTLVEIGVGKNMDVDAIFDARSRAAAGPTAPACGLYFVSAEY